MKDLKYVRQPRSEREQELLVNIFNANPIGSRVRYWKGAKSGLPTGEGNTRTQAQLVHGNAVVWIEGCSGYVAITHVEFVSEPPTEATMIEYTEQERRDAERKLSIDVAKSSGPWPHAIWRTAIDQRMRLTKAEALLSRTQTVQIQSNPQPYHDLNKEIVAYLEGSKA